LSHTHVFHRDLSSPTLSQGAPGTTWQGGLIVGALVEGGAWLLQHQAKLFTGLHTCSHWQDVRLCGIIVPPTPTSCWRGWVLHSLFMGHRGFLPSRSAGWQALVRQWRLDIFARRLLGAPAGLGPGAAAHEFTVRRSLSDLGTAFAMPVAWSLGSLLILRIRCARLRRLCTCFCTSAMLFFGFVLLDLGAPLPQVVDWSQAVAARHTLASGAV